MKLEKQQLSCLVKNERSIPLKSFEGMYILHLESFWGIFPVFLSFFVVIDFFEFSNYCPSMFECPLTKNTKGESGMLIRR